MMKLCNTCKHRNNVEQLKPCIIYRDDCEYYEKERYMTKEEAIHKMEYSKRAYQMLIDEKVQEGVLVGQGINAEWSADTPIIDAYKDMLEACDMAIKALKQEKNIKALGEDMRTMQKAIKNKKVLIGFNMAVAICNKYLGGEVSDAEWDNNRCSNNSI